LSPAGAVIDLETAVLRDRSPLWRAFDGWWPLPWPGGGAATATVVLDEGADYALAQLRRRRCGTEADLLFVAPALDHGNGTALVWQRLLTGACQHVAQAGVQRVHAAIPADDRVALGVLRQVGFSATVTDLVLRREGSEPPPSGTAKVALRPELPADRPAIDQLVRASLPQGTRAHQAAEGSDWWDYPLGGWTHRQAVRRVWLGPDGEVRGAWYLVPGRGAAWLRIVAPPGEDPGPALHAALAAARQRFGEGPVFAAAMGHETALNVGMREAGFAPVTTRFRLVKHHTARVLEPAWRHAADRGLDPIPSGSRTISGAGGATAGPRATQAHRPGSER
jgi:hypothetical protein